MTMQWSGRSAVRWDKGWSAVPALLLLLTGCPAEDPIPIGSVDGGSGGHQGGTGGSGPGGTGGATQPGKTCGGIAGLPCAAHEYCAFAAGQCQVADATGTCAPKAEVCPAIFIPVCGCDGKTYGNDCEAAAAGVSVNATGACSPGSDGGTHSDASPGDTGGPGKMCGGIGGIHCAGSEFCKFAEGQCLMPDAAGTCAPKGQICPAVFTPVCGCDGTTYGNDCQASAAGVSVKAQGACSVSNDGGAHSDASPGDAGLPGKMCGGIAGIACAASEFCQLAVGGCLTADAAGTCAHKGVACDAVFDPVCGCDGKTYGNDCAAASAGVSVKAPGACP